MASVVLDTTILVDLMRLRPQALDRIAVLERTGDYPCVSPVSIEELVRGLRDEERRRAEMLTKGFYCIPLHADLAWIAGDWRRKFAKRGKTLSQADCLIAAAAVGIGGVLATGNPKDFPMKELRVEHWPVGE